MSNKFKKGQKVSYIGDSRWCDRFFADFNDFGNVFEVIEQVRMHGREHLFVKSKHNEFRYEKDASRGLTVEGTYWCLDPHDFIPCNTFESKIDELFEF